MARRVKDLGGKLFIRRTRCVAVTRTPKPLRLHTYRVLTGFRPPCSISRASSRVVATGLDPGNPFTMKEIARIQAGIGTVSAVWAEAYSFVADASLRASCILLIPLALLAIILDQLSSYRPSSVGPTSTRSEKDISQDAQGSSNEVRGVSTLRVSVGH